MKRWPTASSVDLSVTLLTTPNGCAVTVANHSPGPNRDTQRPSGRRPQVPWKVAPDDERPPDEIAGGPTTTSQSATGLAGPSQPLPDAPAGEQSLPPLAVRLGSSPTGSASMNQDQPKPVGGSSPGEQPRAEIWRAMFGCLTTLIFGLAGGLAGSLGVIQYWPTSVAARLLGLYGGVALGLALGLGLSLLVWRKHGPNVRG
jgi:hypothetical protein